MKLTKQDLKKRFEDKRLHLAFVGPSNSGKTFRTRQLQREKGFQTISIDDEIGTQLGVCAGEELAAWMGHPSEPQFKKKQKEYLDLEERLTGQVQPPESNNFILDTTGSVIYLSPSLLSWLKRSFLVVYARVCKAQESAWLDSFLECPKPMIWGDLYRPREGETKRQTLHRCGAQLLSWRHQRYGQLADVSLSDFNASHVSVDGFWQALTEALS